MFCGLLFSQLKYKIAPTIMGLLLLAFFVVSALGVYDMCDPQWGKNPVLGITNTSLCEHGEMITTIANLACARSSRCLNPQEVNSLLTKHQTSLPPEREILHQGDKIGQLTYVGLKKLSPTNFNEIKNDPIIVRQSSYIFAVTNITKIQDTCIFPLDGVHPSGLEFLSFMISCEVAEIYHFTLE